MLKTDKTLTTTCIINGMIMKVNICIKKCKCVCRNVCIKLSPLIDSPLMKKINETAPYLTVISGRRGPGTQSIVRLVFKGKIVFIFTVFRAEMWIDRR